MLPAPTSPQVPSAGSVGEYQIISDGERQSMISQPKPKNRNIVLSKITMFPLSSDKPINAR
jgi:hypothetical protein